MAELVANEVMFDPSACTAFRSLGWSFDEATGAVVCSYALDFAVGPSVALSETFQFPHVDRALLDDDRRRVVGRIFDHLCVEIGRASCRERVCSTV